MRIIPQIQDTAYFQEVSRRAASSHYDTPADYGIPNPLGPRLHNWKGGPLNEGSLYHGPNYTRPAYNLPQISNPLFGVGVEEATYADSRKPAENWYTLSLGLLGTGVLVYIACELLLPKPREYR